VLGHMGNLLSELKAAQGGTNLAIESTVIEVIRSAWPTPIPQTRKDRSHVCHAVKWR
jgi:hypothetical protein